MNRDEGIESLPDLLGGEAENLAKDGLPTLKRVSKGRRHSTVQGTLPAMSASGAQGQMRQRLSSTYTEDSFGAKNPRDRGRL